MKILCIDDDQVDRKIIQRSLKQKFGDELSLETAATADEAFEKLKKDHFDIIFLDYMLGDTTGLEFLDELNNKKITSPVILLTGLGNEEVAIEALKLGAYDYFTKDQLKSERIFQSIINITERKKAEEKIKFEREKLQNIMDSMVDGITITDMEGKIVSVNNAALKQLGYKENEVIGKILGEVFFEEKDAPRFKEIVEMLASGQIIKTQEFKVKRKDKTSFPVSVNLSFLRDSGGQPEAIVAVHRDVTESKKREEDLRKTKEEAEIANRTKSEFLATMSHEIRTPMNAIIGMAELLSETKLDKSQQSYVEMSRNAGENLLGIINDILDLSKVEAGEIRLEKAGFNIVEVVEKTCDVMAFRAHKKEIELSQHINPRIPVDLIGDPTRLRQIFLNLLGNAIKFTDKGEVELSIDFESEEKREVFKEGDGRKNVCLLFSIRDTGVGIPEDKKETIFESFTQADSSTTREYGGTGLGLTICERLVGLMGGNIWVKSEVGKGSTFYFTAKFGIREKSLKYIEPEEMEELAIKDLRTLVVDDTAANRLILREFLTLWGAKVAEAENGKEAISMLKSSFSEAEPFELILLDCRMPKMGGFEVMEKINKEVPKGYVTVMMLTSDNRADDFSRIEKLGIGAYLVKPVKKEELKIAIIDTLRRNKVAAKKQPKVKEDKELSPLKILLVEDTKDNALLVQAYLKKTPYELDMAENGKVAVDKFKSGDYDLVLMDMQMPVMDGFAATEKIREWEKNEGRERTAIVALTAYAMREEVKKTLNAGCDAHLSKPIKKKELMKMIKGYE